MATEGHRILDSLSRARLLGLARAHDMAGLTAKPKDEIIATLLSSPGMRLGDLLAEFSRAELKTVCRALDLDDSGREKAVLLQRLAKQGKITARHSTPSRSEPSASAKEENPSAPITLQRGKGETLARGRKRKDPTPNKAGNGAKLGFEQELWRAADALRNNMDAAEYKHVVLGLIFLKYISDAFEEWHAKLVSERAEGADPEDPDEYRAANIFWVPKEARWARLKANAPQPAIGQLMDDAMAAIERDNPSLKGVLPKDYARPGLDKQRLGQLINLINNIGLGDAESRSKDILGRVYEYFLSQFASAEGKKGGQFYTPRCVVKVLVGMLEPYKGRVYDPCCGSSGMFVQSAEFIEAHASGNGNGSKVKGRISIYGQESNYTTWRLAKMNLAIRGIEGQIAHGDSFHNDKFPDLKADFILANPHFNDSDWNGELLREDKRWVYGVPPAGNANFAWVQHFIHHLAPTGTAGFVLANGSMSSNQSGEGEIRKAIIEADLVDCMIALPGQLFYSTPIPACLWFLARDKKNGKYRDRRGHVLFIDARKLGTMVGRVHRELTEEDIARIAGTYHAWRGEKETGRYTDITGFCKSATLEEIREHGYTLTPGRYVGAEAMEDDGEPFEEKMKRLMATLQQQTEEAEKLDDAITASLKEFGYGK